MSKFLNELRQVLSRCFINHAGRSNAKELIVVADMLDSLGENAYRMLEIGILQDELASLGFKPFQADDHEAEIMYFRLPIGNDETIEVNFNRTVEVGIGMFWCSDLTSKSEFAYNSPTLRENVVNKAKELIND